MAKKKNYKSSRRQQQRRVARTNKKLLTIVISIAAIIIMGLGGLWFFVEYRGAGRNAGVADSLFAEGDFRAARKQYGRAVKKEPTNLEYVDSLKETLLSIVPATPIEARSLYDEYVRTLIHEARYNPLEIDVHLQIVDEMYTAAFLTGSDDSWGKLRAVSQNGLDRVSLNNPRRHELQLYRGLASLRIEDASMTETYDNEGNVRFPGESDFQAVLEVDPGNAMAWAALAHGRMAVYYRLNDEGITTQAERNRVFANDTMAQAKEVAGDSFEVASIVLREMLLRRNVLLQQKVADPDSISEVQIADSTKSIVSARDKLVLAYDPAVHYARAGEVAMLVVSSDKDGKEIAVGVLQKTVDLFPNDFGRKFMLSGMLVELDREEEATVLANYILDAPRQKVGLHAIELFSIRTLVAQAMVRMYVENSLAAEDDDDRDAQIEEANRYREILFELVSGKETNQFLLFSDGILALAEERYYDAAKKLEEAIARNPSANASVYRQSAFALSQTNAKGLAINRLQTAIELEPSNLINHLAKARLEFQLSDYKQAAATLSILPDEAREREDVAELLSLISMQTVGTEQTAFADPALRYISKSEDHARAKEYDEAVATLDNAIELAPEPDWRLFLAMSNVYARMDQREEAVVWIQKAIDVAPNPSALLPQLHVLQSDNRIDALISLINSQDDSEASKAEELAVSLYEMSMNYLGEANRWSQMGNIQEEQDARAISDRALEESAKYQDIAVSFGTDMTRIIALRFNQALTNDNYYEAESLLEEMIQSSGKQIEIDSSRVALHLAKAIDAKEQGKLDVFDMHTASANSIAEKMVQDSAISDYAWRTLGRVLVEIGEMEEATNAYAEAYRISPKNKENIRRYVGILAVVGKEPSRLLRVLRIAKEQYQNDQQIITAWLEAERSFGEQWQVIVHRMNQYVLNPQFRVNSLELAFALTNLEPRRDLIRNIEGEEVYTVRMWEQMSPKMQLSALRDARREWDKIIDQILMKASVKVDTNIRVAHLHASIHRDLGQLDRSSEIWERFIDSFKGADRYTTAVIAAADFLQQAGRVPQAVQLLENARESQSEKYEIDAVLGSLNYILGNYELAAEYMQTAVIATRDRVLSARMIEALALSGQFDEAEQTLLEYSSTNTLYAQAMLRALISRVKSEQLLAQGDITAGRAALKTYRDALRAAINVDAQNPTPYIRLCRSLLNEYSLTQEKMLLEEALQIADEATATGKQSEQFVVVRADALQADGQLNRAIDRLSRFLSDNQNSTVVRQRLIEAYLDSDNVDRALTIAKEGVKVNPEMSSGYRRLGDLHIRANNNIGEGVKAYIEAIQRNPSVRLLMKIDEITRTDQELPNQELIAMAQGPFSKLHPIAGAIEAKSLKKLGRNRDALLAMERSWKMFDQALKKGWISPQSTGSWFLDLREIFKEDPTAGEAFVKALVNGPLSQHQLAGLAGYYYAFGETYTDRALEIIDTALAQSNSNQDARIRLLMMRGGFLVSAKRYEESEQTFRMLASESDSPLVQNNLAYVVGVYQNRPEEGLEIAKRAAKDAPRNPSIVDTVATMYQHLGEHQQAVEALDFLLQLDPSNSNAMAKLSLLYSEDLHEPLRGIVFAERGRSLNPRSPQVLDALGWGYYRTGKAELGEDTIRRSLRQGNTMEAYLHLAQIVTENHEFEEALGHIRMAQELAEDTYSMNRIQGLKDDIRKKKAEAQR